MVTYAKRIVVAGLHCGLIGAIAGAPLGAVAAILVLIGIATCAGGMGHDFSDMVASALIFFLSGLIVGAIGGFVAGFIGASFGGSPGFRVGGVVSAIASTLVFPYIILVWFIPPLLALAVGFLFGLYLDKEIKSETPKLFLASRAKRIIAPLAAYPKVRRIAWGAGVSLSIVLVCLCVAYYCYWR